MVILENFIFFVYPIYIGIKPYLCSICDKNFTQMSSLARHKQMIHGIPKEIVQQYYNPSLISNKSRINSRVLKENKVKALFLYLLIFHQSYVSITVKISSVIQFFFIKSVLRKQQSIFCTKAFCKNLFCKNYFCKKYLRT